MEDFLYVLFMSMIAYSFIFFWLIYLPCLLHSDDLQEKDSSFLMKVIYKMNKWISVMLLLKVCRLKEGAAAARVSRKACADRCTAATVREAEKRSLS